MLRTNYDVIIVGARCAGAPTAMLLARAGARVLLVDRATFPSDTISGHAIKTAGVAYLKRWGLLDRVLASGTPPITQLRLSVGNRLLPMPPPPADPLPIVAPRRSVLDWLLLRAAADAGASVHEQTTVSELVRDEDHVIGIQATSLSGRRMRALAPIVIGADGKQSWVARQVEAGYSEYLPPVSMAYYSYWSGADLDSAIVFAFEPGRAAGVVPTHYGQAMAFIQCHWSERHAFRQDVLTHYVEGLRAFPAIGEVLEHATLEGAPRGMLDLPGFFRQSYGPGWALAGDAAHHKDPIVARGITDAFRDAELLAHTLVSGLGGETDLQPELARYQTRREMTSRRLNALNHRLAELHEDLDETERRLTALLHAEMEVDTQPTLDYASSAPERD
jgi:flavin-dependent dehydrogenase